MEGGDQQAMIAAGQIAADRSGGVAADTVSNEPFALFGNFERPAYLTPEFDCHAARRAGRFGFRRAGLSLCVVQFKAAPFLITNLRAIPGFMIVLVVQTPPIVLWEVEVHV